MPKHTLHKMSIFNTLRVDNVGAWISAKTKARLSVLSFGQTMVGNNKHLQIHQTYDTPMWVITKLRWIMSLLAKSTHHWFDTLSSSNYWCAADTYILWTRDSEEIPPVSRSAVSFIASSAIYIYIYMWPQWQNVSLAQLNYYRQRMKKKKWTRSNTILGFLCSWPGCRLLNKFRVVYSA